MRSCRAAWCAGSTLPVVQKILRTLKHTEDATSQDASANMYILCDMALAMASAIANKQQPVKGKRVPSAAAGHPGNVPLPASFYRSLDLQSTSKYVEQQGSAGIMGHFSKRALIGVVSSACFSLGTASHMTASSLYAPHSGMHQSLLVKHIKQDVWLAVTGPSASTGSCFFAEFDSAAFAWRYCTNARMCSLTLTH